jgi:hypothetical protein
MRSGGSLGRVGPFRHEEALVRAVRRLEARRAAPVPLIILMIPVAIAAANLIVIQPGRLSARLNTAAVLRAE